MQLPLLNIFPVTTRAPTARDIALAKHGSTTTVSPVTYSNHTELIRAVIDGNGCCAASSAVEDALCASHTYTAWQRSMPFLKNVPSIHRYRNTSVARIDLVKVNQEVLTNGAELTKGQLLYRGGKFDALDTVISDGPVSTTLMPSVALWHAREVRGKVAVFSVSDDAIRAFVYKVTRGQKLGHEFEVLLRNNISLTFIDSFEHSGVQIFKYDIRAADA